MSNFNNYYNSENIRQVISVVVLNEHNVLSRIVGLFSARGYNIDSLTVAPMAESQYSRMTIVTTGDKRVIENGAIRGRYNEDGKIEQRLELREDGMSNTLTTVEKDNVVVNVGGVFGYISDSILLVIEICALIEYIIRMYKFRKLHK